MNEKNNKILAKRKRKLAKREKKYGNSSPKHFSKSPNMKSRQKSADELKMSKNVGFCKFLAEPLKVNLKKGRETRVLRPKSRSPSCQLF